MVDKVTKKIRKRLRKVAYLIGTKQGLPIKSHVLKDNGTQWINDKEYPKRKSITLGTCCKDMYKHLVKIYGTDELTEDKLKRIEEQYGVKHD